MRKQQLFAVADRIDSPPHYAAQRTCCSCQGIRQTCHKTTTNMKGQSPVIATSVVFDTEHEGLAVDTSILLPSMRDFLHPLGSYQFNKLASPGYVHLYLNPALCLLN